MMLETMWSLGKRGKRKMTRVRTAEYWKEEKMEEEERMTGRLRTLPPSLEGKEEAMITKILRREGSRRLGTQGKKREREKKYNGAKEMTG